MRTDIPLEEKSLKQNADEWKMEQLGAFLSMRKVTFKFLPSLLS